MTLVVCVLCVNSSIVLVYLLVLNFFFHNRINDSVVTPLNPLRYATPLPVPFGTNGNLDSLSREGV